MSMTAAVTAQARPWVERAARAGYLAKGVVYLVVGILAFQAAAGAGGDTTDTRGVFQTMLRQPLGRWLLMLLALGLAGYALWRLVCALADPEGRARRDDGKRIAVRFGFAGSALVHGALAWQAARLALGDGGGRGEGARDWTARLLAMPLGPWLVGAVGLGIIGYGAWQIYRGLSDKVAKRLALGELSPDQRRLVLRAGRIGMAARGVVFGLVGLFLVRAALQHDASEAGGLREALETLHRQPYAPVLLGAVALGLAAYGAFEIARARYRVIGTV